MLGKIKLALTENFETNADISTCLGEYCFATRHLVSMSNIKVLRGEQKWDKHKVKEAIYRAPISLQSKLNF